MWQIAVIGIVSCIITFPFLLLIPLKSQVQEWKKEKEELAIENADVMGEKDV